MVTKRFLTTTITLLTLAGCSSSSNEQDKNTTAQSSDVTSSSVNANISNSSVSASSDAARLKIADVVFEDEDMARCMSLQGVAYVDEVKTFSCSHSGKFMAASMDNSLSPNGSLEMSLTSIKGLEVFTQLTTLDLSGNWLRSIDLSPFAHLQNLNLSNTIITDLDLSKNIALKTINLDATTLASLNVTGLKEVISLSLSGHESAIDIYMNGVVSDPSRSPNFNQFGGGTTTESFAQPITMTGLDDLAALEVFKFIRHPFTDISLQNLIALKELTIVGAGLSNIDLSQNIHLSKADLSENKFTTIESFIGLNSLTELNLNHNDIKNVTINSGLINLEKLTITNNKMTAFTFDPAPKLKNLNIAMNELLALDIGHADVFDNLYAGEAFAKNESSKTLEKLIGLSLLTGNTLTQLGLSSAPLVAFDSTQYPGLKNLQTLSLDKIKLDAINISNLEQLTELNVSGMGLKTLDLSANTKLQSLNATVNALETIDLSTQVTQRILCYETQPVDDCNYLMFFSDNPIPDVLVKELQRTAPFFYFN